VSRRHCEFWYEDGKWFIKDVKSSSGTFLNHIRLSPPGTESKPFPVNDGDIVQLGIDFKGGEEMIFRCVKMRLELNRNWQSKLNTFKYDLSNRSHPSHPVLTALQYDNTQTVKKHDCQLGKQLVCTILLSGLLNMPQQHRGTPLIDLTPMACSSSDSETTALPVSFRRPMFAYMALQMHQISFGIPIVPYFHLPKLPGRRRP
jgi:pSer/pThr/pTyr-binding forkhead associated (FHA) protein